MLELIHEWFITDNYNEFISEDDAEYLYFMKGISIEKLFNYERKGVVKVKFSLLDNYAYKSQTIILDNGKNNINILNPSNVCKNKPKITLYDVKSDEVIINNKANNKSLEIGNIVPNSTIIIDNQVGTIFNADKENLIKNSNRNWFTLEKGINEVEIIGDCSFKLEAMYPIMR